MATPKYVRLTNRLSTGLIVDMDSGWSISGRDVQPFPEDADQARYVKGRLNQGVLEPASEEEYDATHPDPEANLSDEERDAKRFVQMVEAAGKKLPVQEIKVRQELQRQAEKVRQLREGGGDDGERVVAENKKRVEEQKARGLSGDTEKEEKPKATTGGTKESK